MEKRQKQQTKTLSKGRAKGKQSFGERSMKFDSRKRKDDEYSSDFQSDIISESLPKSGDIAEESIKEESHLVVSKPSSQPLGKKSVSKSITESIQEEILSGAKASSSLIEESIQEDIPVASKTDRTDEISEESYLKDQFEPVSPAKPKPQPLE